jgi:Low affinity iron permease
VLRRERRGGRHRRIEPAAFLYAFDLLKLNGTDLSGEPIEVRDQVKLDELIRVSKANNAFMGLEHLTDEELQDIEGNRGAGESRPRSPPSQRGCETQTESDRGRWLGISRPIPETGHQRRLNSPYTRKWLP